MQTHSELQMLSQLLKDTNNIEGDVVEVGVYVGESAKVLDENKGNRELYLYDTFDGFHDIGENDPQHLQGAFKFEGLEDRIRKDFPNAEVITGYFPDSTIGHTKISFIHLDVDTYMSTLKSLEYVYPLVSIGGIIITHDYDQPALGVKKAFDEFFDDKPEQILINNTSQAYIIKL
jgi:hypothetical protein